MALLCYYIEAVVSDQVLDYAHTAIFTVVLQGARPFNLRHHALLEVLRASFKVLKLLDEHQGPRELVLCGKGFNWRQQLSRGFRLQFELVRHAGIEVLHGRSRAQ